MVIHGVVLALGLVALALGLYKAWVIASVPTRTSYETGYKFAIILAPFIWTGVAALVGWVAYRLRGRSTVAANVGAGVILSAVAAIWGLQIGNYLVNGPSRTNLALAATATPSSALPAPTPIRRTPAPVGLPPASRPPDPPPAAPDMGSSAPAEASLVPETSGPPSRADAPPPQAPRIRPPRPAPPAPAAENPAIQKTLDALTDELNTAAGSLLLMADSLMDTVSKPPPHLRTAIEKSVKDAAALQTAASDLAARFRATKEEAEKRLVAAGVPAGEAFSQAVRYSLKRSSGFQTVACEDYGRLCDAVREEGEFLLENISRWSRDGKGEFVSKDGHLKVRQTGYRFRVTAITDRRADLADKLRGK